MLDVSLGQLIVVGVVGAAVTGRKDLPHAFRFVGSQVGRIVGLLQGARARADQYAAQNELKQLQNELRSGLRELDQVRMELAVAASSQGMVGRNLGALTPSANRQRMGIVGGSTTAMASTSVMSNLGSPPATAAARMSPPDIGYTATSVAPTTSATTTTTTTAHDDTDMYQTISLDLSTTTAATATLHQSSPPIPRVVSPLTPPSTSSLSEKAALEEEWEKQGIGYQTRAEQLYKETRGRNNNNNNNNKGTTLPSGSELLESLIRQQLLWDQYDRVVAEQNSHVQRRMDARTTTTISTETMSDHDDASVPDKKP
jgi:Sec-independent protein translocase protein TatA